jgi:cytochrome c oxidase cbb3-type subunit 3/ubiquinol-cytochrome c reductase cytochrome c subunit
MKIRTRSRKDRLAVLTSALFAVCAAFLLFAMSLFVGCKLPGKPEEGPEVPRPETVTNFDTLYGSSCAGCHGANGQNGAAMNLANPEYQALVDDATLRDIIANGEKGTLMPAFGVKRGGELTDAQIDALVKGMRARWSKGDVLNGQNAPAWKATHAGDAANGQQVYATTCAQCHGESAQKPGKSGSILDGSFLAVVNEQMIRTTVIAGRPDLGMPDWRGLVKGRTLTDNEVTDVTAWLMSQKPALPGQPYGSAAPAAIPAQPAGKPAGKE